MGFAILRSWVQAPHRAIAFLQIRTIENANLYDFATQHKHTRIINVNVWNAFAVVEQPIPLTFIILIVLTQNSPIPLAFAIQSAGGPALSEAPSPASPAGGPRQSQRPPHRLNTKHSNTSFPYLKAGYSPSTAGRALPGLPPLRAGQWQVLGRVPVWHRPGHQPRAR